MSRWKTAEWRCLLAAGLIALALLPACTRASEPTDQAPEIRVEFELPASERQVGRQEFNLRLVDRQEIVIHGAQVELRGDMSHAGMVPVLASGREGSQGNYEVPFEWTMAGDWLLTLTAELPDGRTLLRTYQVTVTSP
jgi:hypothetical protein